MKKITLILLAICAVSVSVFAPNRTRSQITTDINAKFNDNASGDITPAKLREVTKDIIDSVPTFTDEPKANSPHTHVRADVTDLAVFGASGPSHSIGLVPTPGSTAGTTRFLREDATWQTVSGGGGSGTVTSVGLSAPTEFSISGSPVTVAGTLGFAWQNVSARRVLRGPTSGSAAPTFVDLVAQDISDATTAGRDLLTAADVDAQQAILLPAVRSRVTFYSDFLGQSFGESLSSVGTGGSVVIGTAAGGASNPGLVTLSTGTAGLGKSELLGNVTAFLFGGGEARFESDQRIPTLSTSAERYTYRVGWVDASLADAVDGVYFEYDESLSGNWRICTASNSARTKNDSGTAISASTWYRLTIVVNAAGNSAEFFINGASVGTITSNIPTGSGRQTGWKFQLIKTVTTANLARTVDVDYVWTEHRLTTAR